MTDLVDRLRVDGASKIEWEAADEIERLRAALLEIVAHDASHYAHDGNARIVNIARAALKEPT